MTISETEYTGLKHYLMNRTQREGWDKIQRRTLSQKEDTILKRFRKLLAGKYSCDKNRDEDEPFSFTMMKAVVNIESHFDDNDEDFAFASYHVTQYTDFGDPAQSSIFVGINDVDTNTTKIVSLEKTLRRILWEMNKCGLYLETDGWPRDRIQPKYKRQWHDIAVDLSLRRIYANGGNLLYDHQLEFVDLKNPNFDPLRDCPLTKDVSKIPNGYLK